MHLTTLVLIRLHKNADLLETKANITKDRKVYVAKNKLYVDCCGQAVDEILEVYDLKFDSFGSGAHQF